jgi:precorrin-3B methylase
MQTTVFIGNSKTFIVNHYMITPRGYDEKYNLGFDVR